MQKRIQRLQSGLRLGEGPVWDNFKNRLVYVDIENCQVTSIEPNGQNPSTLTTGGMVGCVVPMRNGNILAAVERELVELDFTNQTQTVRASFPLSDDLRFNDGKCDVQGNLWVGTMAKNQSHPNAHECGSLLCIKNDEIIASYQSFSIPNGMAWSEDHRIFYHIDTATRKVDAYTVGGNGVLHEKRIALQLLDEEGVPDGMCMDATGNLWIAMWGGGYVVCYNPQTKQMLKKISVGESNVSCCAFGGVGLQTLYITTAQDDSGRGGSLFAVETAEKGVNVFLYGGENHDA